MYIHIGVDELMCLAPLATSFTTDTVPILLQEECIDSLVRKAGYRGHIDPRLRSSITLTRYQVCVREGERGRERVRD